MGKVLFSNTFITFLIIKIILKVWSGHSLKNELGKQTSKREIT